MIRCVISLALAAILLACGPTAEQDTPATDPGLASVAETTQLSGQQAYDNICARCHDSGLDDAPRTAVREDWEGRSWLWEAVLFEHARSGFGEMPAKGGDESLDDATVTRAAEYMLNKTFPEVTRD